MITNFEVNDAFWPAAVCTKDEKYLVIACDRQVSVSNRDYAMVIYDLKQMEWYNDGTIFELRFTGKTAYGRKINIIALKNNDIHIVFGNIGAGHHCFNLDAVLQQIE